MQFTFTFPTFAAWILIPQNVAGRTKKSVVSLRALLSFVDFSSFEGTGAETTSSSFELETTRSSEKRDADFWAEERVYRVMECSEV